MNPHIAANITLDPNLATNMTRTIKQLHNFLNFETIVEKLVISSVDVSNDKQTNIEEQTLKLENKTNNVNPNQPLKQCLTTFQEQTRFTY